MQAIRNDIVEPCCRDPNGYGTYPAFGGHKGRILQTVDTPVLMR